DAAELPEGELYAVARGTPGFAAPEQASPERDLWADLLSHGAAPHTPERDLRADIFSLGATLHFIATGRAPRAERGHDGARGGGPSEGPGSPPECPEGLRQIVAKATAPEPDERHDSAHEFAWQLRRSLGL
ncbi:MAG TPA: hypothetical protein VFS00_09695, partial [Polyangiaceae bacterium]|nr:hypothetical protein [Polyangiaceae bacterium]